MILATRPSATASPPFANAIGILAVAALAARTELAAPNPNITDTCRCTKSLTSAAEVRRHVSMVPKAAVTVACRE
jgi:hypothetical protein